MTWRAARHAIWFLLLHGAYGYGDHVADPMAFVARARVIARARRRA